MTRGVRIEHQGRFTRATAQGNEVQCQQFRNALLLKEFRILREGEGFWELRRRAYLFQDDWPMQIRIHRKGAQWAIDYCLTIPWGWIAGLVFLTWVTLPFAAFRNAELAFGLAMVVIMLALYKQKFDCRPDARFWQQRPRQRWGELMERLLREHFER